MIISHNSIMISLENLPEESASRFLCQYSTVKYGASFSPWPVCFVLAGKDLLCVLQYRIISNSINKRYAYSMHYHFNLWYIRVHWPDHENTVADLFINS